MTITAAVIADSIYDTRITTMQLRYPRFVHAEFMTHRMLSRNASSSRAIPVERLIQDILYDTAMPIHWGKNQPGMQARTEHYAPIEVPVKNLIGDPLRGQGLVPVFPQATLTCDAPTAWMFARDQMIGMARAYSNAGYHKQIVNRLLEPFSHINVVVTATEWDNFFELRDHPDAQPEIMVLAQAMKAAMAGSTPRQLQPGEWHLPYGGNQMISAARCARVSYMTHDGRVPNDDEDLRLYMRLAVAEPKHLSPLEHQATPAEGRHANLNGWKSFRTELEL